MTKKVLVSRESKNKCKAQLRESRDGRELYKTFSSSEEWRVELVFCLVLVLLLFLKRKYFPAWLILSIKCACVFTTELLIKF